jgi:hypothetical protein
MGRYLLTAFINQEDEFGVGIRAQAGDNVFQLLVLLFIHYDRSRHRFSSVVNRRREKEPIIIPSKNAFGTSGNPAPLEMTAQGHIVGIPLL